MHIRPAGPDDSAELHRLRTLLWPELSSTMLEEELRSVVLDGAQGVMLVAERPGGGLAGMAEVGVRGYAEGCASTPVAYLEAWFVDEDRRRSGVGRALIDAAEAWARRHGFRELASDAELWNTLSHAAHRALGFHEEVRLVCFRKRLD